MSSLSVLLRYQRNSAMQLTNEPDEIFVPFMRVIEAHRTLLRDLTLTPLFG